MPKFYFTFGQRYRHETHLCGGHPDGWFTIEAHNEHQAQDIMCRMAGERWATCYSKEPLISIFPLGELKRFPLVTTIDNETNPNPSAT